MDRSIRRYWVLGLPVVALVYLLLGDISEKIDTDVSGLLPDARTETDRVVREILNGREGRLVYLEIDGLPEDSLQQRAVLDRVYARVAEGGSPFESIVEVGAESQAAAFAYYGRERLTFAFPKWWAARKGEFDRTQAGGESFPDWAVSRAVRDFEDFLESPMAMQLSEPGLIDPLLLALGPLLRMEGGMTGESPAEHAKYFWLRLKREALSPEVQTEVERFFAELADGLETATLQYGGMVRLAQASRELIQADIYKVNLLSAGGVLAWAFLLLRRPRAMLVALPTMLSGLCCALAVCLALFGTVNVLVLVVGSILIGTSIDYAIHLRFSSSSSPARRLVALACLSTVAGFLVLCFSDSEVIREIGAFAAAGLAAAYLVAAGLTRSDGPRGGEVRRLRSVAGFQRIAGAGALLLFSAGAFGWTGLSWREDVRNLEAADSATVEADIALRERIGMRSETVVFLTTGGSYLELLNREAAFLEGLESAVATEPPAMSASAFLPTGGEIDGIAEDESEVEVFFSLLPEALSEAGYAPDAFGEFFERAAAYLDQNDRKRAAEQSIETFDTLLSGPLGSLLGAVDGLYWSLSSRDMPEDIAGELTRSSEHTKVLSQLHYLNESLDHLRAQLLRHAGWAGALVAVLVVMAFGPRMGLRVLCFPLLATLVGLGICAWWQGELHLFHLIGAFLGAAIALDHALFAIDADREGRSIPFSVWLSAATTTASFAALCASSIPVVRGLGLSVVLITCSCLLFLTAVRNWPFRRKDEIRDARPD